MSELAEKLFETLRQKNIMIATAESCTGGMIAGALTDVAGASSVFDRGFVTYTNLSKQELLGVPAEIINRYGAVSEECAKEMAQGAIQNSAADIAVSVTGIAGPDGGTKDKPIGLVYIGVCKRGQDGMVKQYNFIGTRTQIRSSTRDQAFALLLDIL